MISSAPVIVIKAGKIAEKAMRIQKLDLDSLNTMRREKNIFSIADVDYAIFVANGKLAVLLKEVKQPVTKTDINITGKSKVYPIPTEIIVDGKILPENLNLDIHWVNKTMKAARCKFAFGSFFAQVQTEASLFIDKKEGSLGSVP